MEDIKKYTLHENITGKSETVSNENFILPILGGTVSAHFSRINHHYGIDLAGKSGDLVLNTLDGTVIFTEWTIETGHVLVIQHKNDLISIYKNNSLLLKKAGDYVQASDPIAVIGNTGKVTEAPHLHFELWYKGIPINPEDYLIL
jgi:murein DD-endopeptidase MepM/ murein hydrolase activator NlpD